ncbi:MAG: glycosyltransferase [Planctomycetota bacterium]
MIDTAGCSLISCIIPVHNGERYLGDAIESVLQQTYPRLELIVVDDGSTDRSAAVAGSFGNRLRVEVQERGGASVARNRGVELSSGDLIAFLDADDIFELHKLEFQERRLRERPDLDLSAAYVENFKSADFSGAGGHEFHRRRAWPRAITTWVLRRSLWDRVGPFDENMPLSQDVDWHMRAVSAGASIETLPIVLSRRRIHGDNSTRFANDQCRAAVLKSLRKNVTGPRRRQRGGKR